ncbi:50S ribosomal protein L5 [archaeon CG_4_8_14_3_um_filter_38_5]|nr:MAG: 50S ribosomal protein L5 [archaeon CG07_land_8_20_14_0_80_38_8]PIU88967.1 MAG: 50S ribosomal protein L5 [archaeon CG06_land_8_20_14_3_00_37_11]PIX42343.1 MAG: 50S ribosomal protein L5 [archaeon CG_4_8_14_3_um_filter_38_5]
MNAMKNVKIEKLTLNIGVGEPGDKLEKAFALLKEVTSRKPVKTISYKRIPKWNVRPGLTIGVKVTMRKNFDELLKRLLMAKDYVLKKSCFDNYGNISFGIDEYVHVPELKYDPKIPMFGFNVTITLERPGYSVKRRRLSAAHLPRKHFINQEEAVKFMKEKYEVSVE